MRQFSLLFLLIQCGSGGEEQAAAAVPDLPELQDVRGRHPLQRLRGRLDALHGEFARARNGEGRI